MKAAVVNGVGKGFQLEDVELAPPLGREVLVEVRASGLCRTDLSMATHDLGIPMPAVFGHEVAGVVAAVGTDVTRLRVGDHVVACLVQSCGSCARCMAGRPYQCPHGAMTVRDGTGAARLTRDGEPLFQAFGLGGFAERALVHENQLVAIPDAVPFPQAALLGCGVLTGAGAVLNTAAVAAGDTVAVVGAGGVGLNAISGARIAGASRIVALDVDDARLAAARAFGATDVINSQDVDPVAAVRDAVPHGVDHVFDFVGLGPVLQQELAMLGLGGALYLIGGSDPTTELTVNVIGALLGQHRVQGVVMGSANMQRDIPLYADLYLQGRMELDALVSREISLAELDDAYALLNDGAITRIVVTSF